MPLAVVALVAAVLAVNWPVVEGRVAPRWDADDQFAPHFILVADFVQAGRLLRWNPWNGGGSPDFAEPQLGATSPLMLAFGLLVGPTLRGFFAYWLALWLLGAVGMLALARHLRAPPWACLVVALGWAFSGLWTGHAQHTSHLCSLALLPWVVWRFDAALQRRSWWPAVEAGALWGLSALAGYPGLTVLTGMFLFAWAAGLAMFNRRWRHALGCLGLVAVVGLVVMAPPYFAFLHALEGYTSRSGPLPRQRVLTENPLEPRTLVSFASPFLSILQPHAAISGIYTGFIVPAMALAAVILRPRDPRRALLLVISVLFLLTAMADTFPLRGWLYDWCYPTRYFRHALIFRNYAVLGICTLAALGLRDWDILMRRGARRPLMLVSAGVTALAVAAWLAFSRVGADFGMPGRDMLFSTGHVAGGWVAIAGLALLAAYVRGQARLAILAGLILLALTDAQLTRHLSRHSLYATDSESRQVWQELQAHHDSTLELTQRGLARPIHAKIGRTLSNRNQIIKKPAFWTYTTLQNDHHVQWTHRMPLPLAVRGAQRIYFSPEAPLAPASEEAFEVMVRRAEQQGTLPLLRHEHRRGGEADDVDQVDIAPACVRAPVRLRAYEPDKLDFDVECPEAGWLLVTDRWARDWQATVNGQQRRVWQANFIFRAVRVDAGPNRVIMTYDPPGHLWLVALSWTTLGLVALISAVRRRGRTAVQLWRG